MLLTRSIISQLSLAFVLLAAVPRLAQATVDDVRHGNWAWPTAASPFLRASTLPPAVAFERAQSVLRHFGIAPEGETQSSMDDLHGAQTLQGLHRRLPSLDLSGDFWNYASLITRADGYSELQVFQDRKSKRVLDYSVRLAGGDSTALESPLESKLRGLSSRRLPLQGLRIALDPGHMGGPLWSARAGKYVSDGRGNRLDEGLLVLQTALLLERELEGLGAEVMITHRRFEPVTSLSYESYDLHPKALETLQNAAPSSWFQDLLSVAASGDRLFRAFQSAEPLRKIFSESQRWRYFFQGVDLDARVAAFLDYQPDLTLILHLDAGEPQGDRNGVSRGYNTTKVYVPGGFFGDEFATREQRRDFGRHLLDAGTWDASVRLSRHIVRNIHSRMGVPLETSAMGNSALVEPGVFARNLGVQRPLTRGASAFVEAFFYNDPKEFAALLQSSGKSVTIDGVNYPYSPRIEALVESLRNAVLGFTQDYAN